MNTMRTKRSRRELCTQASSLMRLWPAPSPPQAPMWAIAHVFTFVESYVHCLLPTLSASLPVSLPLSRFGLKHFFRNCIVNNVVLILESAMFPVFMGLMLLFIGPQCCIRPRPAPNYVWVWLWPGGTFSCCPWYLIRKCIARGAPLLFRGLRHFPHSPLPLLHLTMLTNEIFIEFRFRSFQT